MPKKRRSSRVRRCRSPTRKGTQCKNRVAACADAANCLCYAHGGPTAARHRALEHAAFFDLLKTPTKPSRSKPRTPHSVFFASP